MAASWMCSGVLKSGWPMPRLMMSRPCAASAFARASTAKAFSSPMRSKFATVFSMAVPRMVFFAPELSASGRENQIGGGPSGVRGQVAQRARRGAQNLENHRGRPAEQEHAVHRRDRAEHAPLRVRENVAIAERRVVDEGEIEAVAEGHEIDQAINEGPHRYLDRVRDQQHKDGGRHDGDVMPYGAQTRGRMRSAPRRGDDPGHDRGVDRDVDEAADGADGELAGHGMRHR